MRRTGVPARLLTAVVSIALLQGFWTVAGVAAGEEAKIEPALLAEARAHPETEFDVIVRATAQETGHDQSERAGSAVQRARGKPTHALGIVGAATATLSGAELIELAQDGDVDYVFADRQVTAMFDPVQGAGRALVPGILEIGAPSAWQTYGVSGRGVGIAVVDSGVAAHRDLSGRIVAAIDFTSAAPAVSISPLGDPGGHGTHVAGLVAGDGTSSGGAFTGVAPNANIIDVRVIGADGTSNVSTVLRGLQWVLNNRKTYNIRVANLSFGMTPTASYVQDLVATAAEVLTFANIVVVAAAGNGGPAALSIASPAHDPFVIAVGAIDDNLTPILSDDQLAWFTAIGPTAFAGIAKPDIVAPGRFMVSLRSSGSTLDVLYPTRRVLGQDEAVPSYFRMSGTSMAAPLVAGTVALMLERNPTLTPPQVKARLRSTATSLSFASNQTTGAGMVNAAQAVGSVDPSRFYSAYRVTDAFARDMRSFIQGQPIQWKDLSYKGGQDSNGRPWATVTWATITWDTITWENIVWESFTWETITWETITWQTVTWETTTTLTVGSLAGAGGWKLLD